MKFKDLITVVKNSRNGQTNFNLKKKELKKRNISEQDILDMDMKFLMEKRK